MTIETIMEWIQTNPVQTEFMAIQLAGIVGLGCVLYTEFRDLKYRRLTHHEEHHEESLKQPYASRNLPE